MKNRSVAIFAILALVLHIAAGQDKCPVYCTYLEYSPTCGMRADGTKYQFVNTCDYRTYECNHPGEFISIRPGPCL